MSETIGAAGSGHPSLNLTPEEKRVYAQLLKEADPDGFGAVSGDVAVKFFEKTRLAPDVLGQIWQIADTENRGFLTPAGFGVVLRLIGHAQAGRGPSAQLAPQPGPLPRFDGLQINAPPQPQIQPIASQNTGTSASPTQSSLPPIRVPALTPEKVIEYSGLFEKSGAENGALSGLIAKQIFERARLPNEVLGRIWTLADSQGRGSLDVTEFVIAMHLLASYKSGAMRGVPSTLPPGLYEAASRRPQMRVAGNSRPASGTIQAGPFTPQATGFSPGRPQSPIVRQQMGTPLSQQSTGDGWVVTPADKARFDSIFTTVDKQGRGFITGDQAVEFFGNARLPEEILAQIWDLADINSEGQLNKDEFAVAMYLIRQQRGTKDGRGILPQTLPPALIPPSMRKQQIPPPQPTAPAFETAQPTKPRSAADDLFGLDAFGPPPTAAPAQIPQSTGGTDAGPFANPSSPIQTGPNTFKPFIPTSTFGQSIIPQSTGSPAPAQNRAIPAPVSDDLLGDADPEVSQKLTNETSELGNLSNQVGSLSKQMTELQTTRAQTDQELSQSTLQKRAFEGRLAQLRSLYEKEVSEVKSIQEQLTASKNETKRLQQDMAVIDGSHQDLSTQHQQIRAAFEADQRENASLKEKIRITNAEIEQLKPQIEKLKSEARQQKGLVAINKKQLATNETERERIKAEIVAAQKELEEASKELENTSRQLETSHRDLQEARNTPVPSVKSPPAVASPAPSTSSNPFFRRTTSEVVTSPPVTHHEEQQDNRNAFDSIFGPSFATTTSPPPNTSFKNESTPNRSMSNLTSPHADSPASSTIPDSIVPPEPPQSKQITSASLPFRHPIQREASLSSSVQVGTPGTRHSGGETPRALTPNPAATLESPRSASEEDPFTAAGPDAEQESIRESVQKALPRLPSQESTATEKADEIPGAFPDVDTPRHEEPPHDTKNTTIAAVGAASLAAGAGLAAAVTNGTDKAKDKEGETLASPGGNTRDSNFDDFFGGPAHQRTASEQAADFDAAFASMKPGQETNGTSKPSNEEFPAIQELDDDEDDDSSDEDEKAPMGFDDDFNATKANAPTDNGESSIKGKEPEVASAVPGHLQVERPAFGTTASSASSLPGFDQQKSPPTYNDAVPSDNPSHFPLEYKGLLPERENPTSPPAGGNTNPAPPFESDDLYGPEVSAPKAVPTSPPPASSAINAGPDQGLKFDFDSAFAGVGPAQMEDDEDEEDDGQDHTGRNHAAVFDPTFDSPAQPRSPDARVNNIQNGSPAPKENNFVDFSASQTAPATGTSTAPAVSHDWDALFSGFDTPKNSAPTGENNEMPVAGTNTDSNPVADTLSPLPAVTKAATNSRPVPGRALSAGTEHDDPILKRLTAMGWNREESVAALERFDYNIDKAADYLTFRS